MAAEQRLRQSASGVRLKIDAAIAQPVQVGVVDAQGRILYLGATTGSSNTLRNSIDRSLVRWKKQSPQGLSKSCKSFGILVDEGGFEPQASSLRTRNH